MPFASINSTNPRTNPWKFHEKILRIGGAGKWGFFEAAILNFLSRPFWIFFCFISVKNPAHLYEVSFFSALWMVFPESWKRRVADFYAHDCSYNLLSVQWNRDRTQWLGKNLSIQSAKGQESWDLSLLQYSLAVRIDWTRYVVSGLLT